jgi:hypothetical protein
MMKNLLRCITLLFWLPASITSADISSLDPVDSGQITKTVYWEGDPTTYAHSGPLNLIGITFEGLGPMGTINLLYTGGYLIFDSSLLASPIQDAWLQFDLTGVAHAGPGVLLQIQKVQGLTAGELSALPTGPVTYSDWQAVGGVIIAGQELSQLQPITTSGIVNVPLNAEAIALINNSGGLFSMGLALAPPNLGDVPLPAIYMSSLPRLFVSSHIADPENPVLPPPAPPGGGWRFDSSAEFDYYDPEVAVGYSYETNSDELVFAGVKIPYDYGDGSFDLFLYDELLLTYIDSGIDIATTTYFDFAINLGAGLRRFELRGIELEAEVNPADPHGFVTGLDFSGAIGTGFCMMPIVHGQITTAQPDTDLDGILDACDNCPEVANPDQEDSDGNGQGNVCQLPPGCI